jgi:hypothetical protein
MAEAVYVLCTLVSLFCAFLLIRSYRSSRLRLTLLASLCFSGLALNNVLLFADLVMTPETDLALLRGCVAVVSMLLLVGGLILEDA